MCGKGSQSGGGVGALGWGGLAPAQQQTMQASPEALGWYRQAMQLGQQAVSRPYQQFGTTPEQFVAQLTPTQQQAISNISGTQGMAQPYYQAAAGVTGEALTPASQTVGQYMSPFMGQVVSPVQQAVRQQQGQQLAQQQAEAIRGGAFGGERAGLQRAQLMGQQNLGLGQALSPLYQTGYGQALQAAQQQQGLGLQGAQQLAGLGTAAQQAALQQAQAQLGAGTLQQQTAQAGIDALRQQFQQQQMFPYMQAQFLGGLAGGLGPLLGQQTYQARAMSPFGSFFADGGAVDGEDDAARMGGAVVDEGDYYTGGIAPAGYAKGGVSYASDDVGDILRSQREMYHPYQEEYEKLPTGEIKAAQGLQPQYLTPEQQQKTGLKDITGAAKDVIGIGKDIYGMFSGKSSDESERGGMGTEGEEDSKTGMLKSLGKMGLSAAANYFLPGSGTLLSGFMADGGRIHKQEAGPVIGGVVPSDEQLDYVARTMMREDPRNMEAIGHVIRNRMLSGRYGTTPQEVVTARKQFTPWNEELRGTRADPRLIKTSDPLYAKALGAARTVFGGESEDPTGGATHFYNPKLASPKWGSGMQDRIQIGEHAYGKADAGAGLGNAARSELAASRAAIPMGDPRRRFIAMDREKPTEEPKEEGGLGGLLTEQNVLPALMGIGKGISGMMSAKTVSPGAAIAAGLGEGLAGGAESYLGTKKTLADVAKTRAEEALRRAQVGVEEETAGLLGTQSLKEAMEAGNLGIKQMGPADAPFYIVTTEDGTKMFLDQWASMESPPNLIGGAVVSNIAKRLAAKSGITSAAPVEGAKPEVTAPATSPAPTQPRLTTPPEPVQLTPGVIYDDGSKKLAQEDKKLKFSSDPSLVRSAEEARKDYFPYATREARSARENTPYLYELSSTLADAYKGKGIATPGFAGSTRAQILKAADTFYRGLGGEGHLSNLPSNADVTAKITSLLGRQSAATAGQESYAALNAIREAIPNLDMDPRAGAQLVSELLVLRKKALDREEHMKAWSKDSGGILFNAQKDFSDKNTDAKYQIAQKVIADMILHHPDAYERIMSGTMSRENVERQIRAPKEQGGYGAGVPVGISEFFPSTETTRRKTP